MTKKEIQDYIKEIAEELDSAHFDKDYIHFKLDGLADMVKEL